MSSNRVEPKKAQISAAIKTLKESSNLQEKCKALSCIQSVTSRPGTQDLFTESQSREICRLVINAFTSGHRVLYPEASCTLVAIIRSYKDRKPNLFQELMQINFENRLKIFQLFEGLQDETIAAVSQDSFIVEFLKDCLSSVSVQKMPWLAPTACADDIKALQVVEYRDLSPEEQMEERIAVSVLGFIHRLYKLSDSTSYAECTKFSALFTDKIAPLAYMGHKRQRAPAIKILQLPNIGNHIRSNSPAIWQEYKTALQNIYCQRMSVLVTACEADWSLLWTTSIQILGTDLHRGAGLINNLLSVEEKAFKSVDTVVRRKAFLSWKLIVDNFALDEQELATARRVKLLCIPLNAKNSKTESMTLTKLEVWWHLIYRLYNHVGKFTNPVLTQFLNFCFGPLGDTPLLSSKFNVIASPGKRFSKTRLVAIDALLQLLTDNKEDLKLVKSSLVKSSLEERIPAPVTSEVFQECFKAFIHSVGEACLSLAQFVHRELETRGQIISILWKTLLARIRDVKDEAAKAQMYKEVMSLVVELSEHSESKLCIRDSMLDVILPSVDEFPNNYIFHLETTVGLMTVFTKPAILSKIVKKHHELIKCLLWRGVKPPQAMTSYVPNTLKVLRKLVEQLDSIKPDVENIKGASVLWSVLCEMVTRCMMDGNDMNEGDAAAHNFTTVEILVKFPFTDRFAPDIWQFKKTATTWKALYKQFDLQASLVPTAKPNEYVSSTIAIIQDGIKLEKRCAGFAVGCLDGILTTMNYKHVLDENGFLPIVKLINELCIINLDGRSKDAEAALRELSSVLITLYGHAPTKVVSCLEAVCPAIEHMLKSYKEESLVKEIISTWETIMSIFKGLGNLLSPKVIVAFQQAIRLALRHEEREIVSQTLSCLETEEFMNGPTKDMVQTFLKEINDEKVGRGSESGTDAPENDQKQTKPAKLTGSFLNRKTASPKPATPTQKPRDEKKSPFFPDPESQEYVTIQSEFKFDAKRLTEHQKESLLRRREDIPALYNDLSQSCSQDTQNIQEWFDKRKNEVDKVATRKSSSNSNVGAVSTAPTSPPLPPLQNIDVGDANKENKLESVETAGVIVADAAKDEPKPSKKSEMEKTGNKRAEQKATSKEQSPENLSTEENLSQGIELGDKSEIDKSVAKKLDFESRTEFPEDGSTAKRASEEPSTSWNSKTIEEKTEKIAKAQRDTKTIEDSVSQGAVSLKEPQRGAKRKAVVVSDSDSEGNAVPARRRRKINPLTTTIETQSDSDSIQSTESEGANKQLSKRTKKEMSRLKINMVFDKQFSTLPSRRRSKVNYEDENDVETDDRESPETIKLTRQKALKTTPQETPKPRVKAMEKEPKNIAPANVSGRKRGRRSVNTAQDEQPVENKAAEVSPSRVISPSSKDATGTTPNEQNVGKTKPQESPESKKGEEALEPVKKVIITEDRNVTLNSSEHSASQSCNDSEEIVESSQASSTGSINLDKKYNKQCFIRINKIKGIQPGQTVELGAGKEKNKTAKGTKPESPVKAGMSAALETKTSPQKSQEGDDPVMETAQNETETAVLPLDNTEENKSDVSPSRSSEVEDKEASVVNEVTSSSPESRPPPTDASSSPVRLPTSLLNSCSPKNSLKRYSKLKSVTTQGRAAHMLGLVTKQAMAETRTKALTEDDASPSKKKAKDVEEELVTGKKERLLVLKEPERLGSPSGSRQEKIFNKMRTASDNEVPLTASNLFSNLKNDGEKSSPGNNSEKEPTASETIVATPQNEKIKDKTDDGDTSPTQEKEVLPMLEWSSANPPSLTASPSASILKRQRQLQIENDPESPTTCKRKRVSFADPPVSKEMGYEIPASTPAHRMSKISASRIFLPRKDSPVRLKQTKLKLAQCSFGKSDKETEMEIEKSAVTDTEAQVLRMESDEDTASKILADSDTPVIVFAETQNDFAKVTIDNLTAEVEIASGSPDKKRKDKFKDVTVIKEANSSSKPKINETETQQDIFDNGSVDESYQSPKNDPKRSPKSRGETSPDENSLRCVDINTLTNNPSYEENNSARSQSSMEVLEDTVDIQNVTGLNSTTNSEEMFCSRPVRTSTQSTEADTLTVTDSVFSSLPFSQSSQATNDTMELDQPELLDSTRSVFPSLTDSSAPIDSIIGYLADPLWKPSLSSYFHSKGIETVGNLAKLPEREVNWIPVKRSPKVPFVRNVLQHFEKSVISLPSIASAVDASQESGTTTPNVSLSSSPPTSTPIAQSSSLCATLEEPHAGHSTNESPVQVEVKNQSTETQVTIEELIDQIDSSVVLKSAIKRCSAENILANYKLKMKNMAEEDLERETIKMLGIESKNNADAHLKSACRSSGLTKVLGRLPDIFNHDKKFFAKVLMTYRHKIQASDCIRSLDFEEVKRAVCQQCTSSTLAEMLSRKLKEEEEAGVTTPMTELSSLQAMLKRMPKDLIISHTVANEELISPLIILDIALQNNTPTDIFLALDGQPTNVRNEVFGDLCTIEALLTQIEERNYSDETLIDILKTVSKKLDAPKLLDAFNAIIKDKFLQKNPPSNT